MTRTVTPKITVESSFVKYEEDAIVSEYDYHSTRVVKDGDRIMATPLKAKYNFRTSTKVPRLGVMLIGWGGNNGTTVTCGIAANKEKLTWDTRNGKQTANYFGSVTQCGTVRVGDTDDGEEVYVPFKDLLPMVDPSDIVIGGWDISSADLATATKRARVLEPDLISQLEPQLSKLKPLPSVYYADFIAENQRERADNILTGTKQQNLEHIRKDIQQFKESNVLDEVILLWTANTERFCELTDGVHDTADNVLEAIKTGHKEISPSSVFAVASILEGCTFINGSPQNTIVPGIVQLAEMKKVYVAGDDFKTGQTKIKSVLVDFLVSAGIKPTSIVSYNHLGNNDGRNLSSPMQFRSKEISKSNVVDDMVKSNSIMYKEGEKPDHCVVIKYVPYVGDSKRAMDEYTSQIFCGGHNTIAIHNTCEDSLLAAPLIIDLMVFSELCNRISYKTPSTEGYQRFDSVLSILSYLLKAPMVPKGTPVVNALFRQRNCIENIMRACIGLQPSNHMLLEHKTVGYAPSVY